MCEWPKYRTHWKESSIRPLEFPPLPNSISHAFLGKNDVRSSKLNFAATSNWARLMPPLRRPWQRSMRSRVSPRCSTSRREGKCPTRVSGKLKDKKYDRFIVVYFNAGGRKTDQIVSWVQTKSPKPSKVHEIIWSDRNQQTFFPKWAINDLRPENDAIAIKHVAWKPINYRLRLKPNFILFLY